MGWTFKTVLMVARLLTSHSSAVENNTMVLQLQDTTVVIQTDPVHVALTKMGIAVAIILGGCLLFRELTLGILDKLATRDDDEEEEEEEEEDDDDKEEEEEEDDDDKEEEEEEDDDDKEEKEKESENEEDEEKEDDEEEDDDEQMYSSYTHYDRKDTYYNRPNFYDYHNHPSYYRSLVDNECFLARIFYSIDPVESAFAMLQVEELACRRRTVCELQKAASRMPILGSLLQYVSRYIRGLEVYREAQEAGAALEDCALLFSECPTTLVQANEPRHKTARPA